MKEDGTSPGIQCNMDLDIPLPQNYRIVGSRVYFEQKKIRPLSLSSLQDLKIVKHDGNEKPHDETVSVKDEDKKTPKTLLIASAALTKFRSHAKMKRSELRNLLTNAHPENLLANDYSKVDEIKTDDIFDRSVIMDLRYEK